MRRNICRLKRRGRYEGLCGKGCVGMQGIGRQDAVLDQFWCRRRQRLCGADSASRAFFRPIHRDLGFYRKEECQQAKRERERGTPAGKKIGERS